MIKKKQKGKKYSFFKIGVIYLKSDSHLTKKIVLFASLIALQK